MFINFQIKFSNTFTLTNFYTENPASVLVITLNLFQKEEIFKQ
jgi:hypothetical protein